MVTTTDPDDPRLTYGVDEKPTTQAAVYLVMTEEERARGFVRPVRRRYVHTTCNTETTMAVAIAETYAANPAFYRGTWCVHCAMHRPVGEFTWSDDGTTVGT